jgi:hypothetical protein
VVRAGQKPGRRRAVPEPRPTARRPRVGRLLSARKVALVGWAVAALVGLAGAVVAWTPLDVPHWVPPAGAVLLTTALAFALAIRSGGRAVVCALLALAFCAAAVVSDLPVLLAGAAIATATIGAVLGVLATTPAPRFVTVVRECAVATVVAVAAAFGTDAYGAQVSRDRAGYLVLGLALLGALALCYRLAAGLQGLGRRGAVILVGGVALLAVSLAYTEALARWGSLELVGHVEQLTSTIRDGLGAVPRPTQILLGYPALAWGVSTRARRRQGWWGVGFGAAGLAVVTVTLLDQRLSLLEAGLGLGYGFVLGVALGYLVIRSDRFLSGARGRRARRLEEAAAHRPEPGRLAPLL